MFKFKEGNICMIKYAPKEYDHLNGCVVVLYYGVIQGVALWYVDANLPMCNFRESIPESWLWKFKIEKEDA